MSSPNPRLIHVFMRGEDNTQKELIRYMPNRKNQEILNLTKSYRLIYIYIYSFNCVIFSRLFFLKIFQI